MASKTLLPIAHPEPPLARRANRMDVPIELVSRQETFIGAIALCTQLSGLDDKEIYMTLEIDAGHWSRIVKGDAHFPVNKIDALMNICGNEAPLLWLANRRGYGLQLLKSEAERRIEDLEHQLQKETERRQWAEELAVRRT